MSKPPKTMELKFERVIPAKPSDVYTAWLDKKTPGTTWHENDKLILNAKVNGFFYWLIDGNAHYGRFLKMQKSKLLQYTWMSRHTLGEESKVTVTFKKIAEGTLMTLVHSDLPKDERAKVHEAGWNHFLDKLTGHYQSKVKKAKK